MYGEAPTSYLTGVPGWETVSEQALLVKLAKEVTAEGVIVEIGAEFGMSASLFAYAALETVEIWSVDLFPGELMAQHLSNLVDAKYAIKTPAGIVSRTNVIQGDSVEIGRNWQDINAKFGRNGAWIDLLFVDGDHSYVGVMNDLMQWGGKVKPGGRIAFHDVAQPSNPTPHPSHHEVAKAISDWRGDQPVGLWADLARVDSMLVIERH